MKVEIIYIVEITQCSFGYMWYKKQIGLRFECRYIGKPFLNFLSDNVKMQTVKPIELSNGDQLTGWIIEGDYKIINQTERIVYEN